MRTLSMPSITSSWVSAVDLDRPLQCCRVKPAATLIAAISRLMEEFISMAMTFWLCKVFKMT
jgi:hypothetical protein